MTTACRKANRVETGGILTGCYAQKQHLAVVKSALVGGSDSAAGTMWFVRGITRFQRALDLLWRRNQDYYLGEWHYHPYASPAPSAQDRRQMKRIAATDSYHCPEPVLAILGGDPAGNWTLHLEVFTRQGACYVLRETLANGPGLDS